MSKEWMEAISATTAFDIWLFVIGMIVVIVGGIWSARND